jgi:hypothetical protein
VTTTVTTTMRVIGGVHNHAANRRTETFTASTSCFTDFNVLVLLIADATDTGHAGL